MRGCVVCLDWPGYLLTTPKAHTAALDTWNAVENGLFPSSDCWHSMTGPPGERRRFRICEVDNEIRIAYYRLVRGGNPFGRYVLMVIIEKVFSFE